MYQFKPPTILSELFVRLPDECSLLLDFHLSGPYKKDGKFVSQLMQHEEPGPLGEDLWYVAVEPNMQLMWKISTARPHPPLMIPCVLSHGKARRNIFTSSQVTDVRKMHGRDCWEIVDHNVGVHCVGFVRAVGESDVRLECRFFIDRLDGILSIIDPQGDPFSRIHLCVARKEDTGMIGEIMWRATFVLHTPTQMSKYYESSCNQTYMGDWLTPTYH